LFAFEQQTDLELRLDADHQAVWHDIVFEDLMRRVFELDHDHGRLPGHIFSGSEEEGNALPAIVVDEEFGGDQGLGVGIFGDLLFVAIGGPVLAMDLTSGILSAYNVLEDLFGSERTDTLKHFHLLVTNGLGLVLLGAIHGDDTKELEQVVLDHVSERAAAIVITAAFANADLFGNADLDMIDAFVVPQRLEHIIGKTEGHEVLDHLLAEVVVDVVDLFFLEAFAHVAVELLCAVQVGAKRFFDDDTVEGIAAAKLVVTQGIGYRLDEAGCDGEVEHADAADLLGVFEFFYGGIQGGVSRCLHEIALDINDAFSELSPFLPVRLSGTAELVDAFEEPLAIGVLFYREEIDAKDGELVRQMIVRIEIVECGDELTSGEVTFGPEDGNGRWEYFLLFHMILLVIQI